jgi:cobalt transporter subunit CbtB
MQSELVLPAGVPARRVADRLPALALLLFGMVTLYGVGFSTISAAHNAAHDTRHAAGFPCH